MTLVFRPDVQNVLVETLATTLDSAGVATLELRAGFDTLQVPLSTPSFVGGALVPVTSGPATTALTPTEFSFKDGQGREVFRGDMPSDLFLNGPIAEGDTVTIDGFQLTQGAVQSLEAVSTDFPPYRVEPDELSLSADPVLDAVAQPKGRRIDPLVAQALDGSGATRTARYDGANVLLDGTPLFSAVGVTYIDLTFDNDDRPLVVYSVASSALLIYDGQLPLLSLGGTGEEPHIHNDGLPDGSIVISYRRGVDVFYRVSLAPSELLAPDIEDAQLAPLYRPEVIQP